MARDDAGVRNNRPADYYDDGAAEFAARYDAIDFWKVHAPLRRHLPDPPASVLDIGSGSGRDALALARLGYDVVAIEPSPRLRAHAAAADVDGRVRWLHDRLPSLPLVSEAGRRFDLILCSAVLMHVAPDAVGAAIGIMASLLAENGRLAVTIRDPLPGEPLDFFHAHAGGDLLANAACAGLMLVDCWTAGDALGRDRTWSGYVFVRP